MSIRIERKQEDWIGKDGHIGIKGVEYCLQQMDAEDIKLLDLAIKEELFTLKLMMKRKDLDDIGEGWQGEVLKQVNMRKRQVNAIMTEFSRRKKLTRSLESFAFSAIYEVFGKEALEVIKDKARDMQEADRIAHSPGQEKKKKTIYQQQVMNEDRMCGPKEKRKVKHITKEAANSHIEDMRARGLDTTGMNTYQCPYCSFFHVGHRPKGVIWTR